MSEIEISKEEEFIEQEKAINGYALRASFDSTKYEKIRNLELNLKGPNHGILAQIGNFFRRNKIVHHEYMELEHVIPIQETSENRKLNLLTKKTVTDLLNKLPKDKRDKMQYVYLAGIQILCKSTFQEGIDCPIIINLSDERFTNASDENLGIVKGNLAYKKLLFTYFPKYCISLKDKDFNNALSLHFQILKK